MSERYVHLDNNHDPAMPHYFADYEGMVKFMLADRLRQSDRHEVILIRYDGSNWVSTAKHTEFYTAGRWFDAHILDPDVSQLDEQLLESWAHPETASSLRFLLDMRHQGRDEDNTSVVHTADELIRQLAERLPGAYDRQHIPGTLIPSEANYAHLLPNGIRFDSFDCDELLHINTDAAEYHHTRAEIEAHWNQIKPSLELGCPGVQTYECGHTWIG